MRRAAGIGIAFLMMMCSARASDFREVQIFAENADSPTYQKQAAEFLAHWRGLRERDVEISTTFGRTPFEIVLIGKDGGEKLRQGQVLSSEKLFGLIDAMPMRQAERK